MKPMLRIGASKRAVVAAKKAIISIMQQPRDEATVREGLRTFTEVTQIKGAVVSNNVFNAHE